MDSDKLDKNLSLQEMEGKYFITKEALNKLERYYNSQQLDSIKYSFIELRAGDSSIIVYNAPLNESIDGIYSISSGDGKLNVTAWDHEKFRFIERPDSQYPNMKFRKKNGQNSILINLNIDPDSFDYYEYVIKR